MVNPLKQYTRIPKVYLKLPSMGKFYPANFINYSPNGEVGVKALTAADDMVLNNSDALLNGDAVFQVLKSCIDCRDVKQLLLPDVNSIMLAIRSASKGDKIKFETNCPHCKKDHTEEVSILKLLSATVDIDSVSDKTKYVIETPDATLIVNIKPSPYTDVTEANLLSFEQARLVQFFRNSKDISDEVKKEKMKEAFDKIIKLQQRIFVNSVEKVDIIQKNGEDEIVTAVTDKAHIAEFIRDLEDSHAKKINEQLEVLNSQIGTPDTIEVLCECEKSFKLEVKFDPVNFSEDSFLAEAVKM